MSVPSPVKSSNFSTPPRPRTRSVSSRDELGSFGDNLEFTSPLGEITELPDPSQNFVNGSYLHYLFIYAKSYYLGTESQFYFDDVARRQVPNLGVPAATQNSDCVFVGTSIWFQ